MSNFVKKNIKKKPGRVLTLTKKNNDFSNKFLGKKKKWK
jgi:hypothetical protein